MYSVNTYAIRHIFFTVVEASFADYFETPQLNIRTNTV